LTLLNLILEQALAWSLPELVAVFAAVVYLVLAIRENIWCWLFAAISTAIYIGLFVAAKLYMESVLNGYYLIMAAYGWYVWSSSRDSASARPVVIWPLRLHLAAITGVTSIAVVNGFLLESFSDAAYPYVDSATTWFAFWATFLLVRKVLENWWYWLAIDCVSILIYWDRGLQLTALLFVVYVCMIPFGLMSWNRSMREHVATTH
jgi:nicotinamide mononucleotide transporter